jgi:hypothetical protein
MREQTHEKIDQEDVAANGMDTAETAPYRKGKSRMLRSCIDKLSLTHQRAVLLRREIGRSDKRYVRCSTGDSEEPDILGSQATCEGSRVCCFRNPKTFAG